ncbi:hypothetical protein ST201phi2-1p378 [Pseudomonas phage 201phi2-1]|uniref:Uncharacterized protein n=1 Tax=Pseudomonas phage 201phi2-1 TaxID=198110 RepID=B3FJN8_BP201|nr:hypothetical protein ST201phi2-1p378 [Pseudomonas phage 201phi2-1]ABY63203.1 hypothetical protein 201phi2-1p378 [Pseudomonas phage 201phi2-1]
MTTERKPAPEITDPWLREHAASISEGAQMLFDQRALSAAAQGAKSMINSWVGEAIQTAVSAALTMERPKPDPEAKAILDGSVCAITIGQCEELLLQIDDDKARAAVHSTVEHVLEVINDQFYLTPKVQASVDGTLTTRPAPVDSIDANLALLWEAVSN